MADFSWGINAHGSYEFVSEAEQLDLAQSIGLSSLRVDVYDASPTTLAWLSHLVTEAGYRGMTILPVIVPSAASATSEAATYAAGYATASALAAAFPGLTWEVGNELDMYAVKPGTTGESTADYNDVIYALTRGAIRGMSDGIHQADPTASVAVGIAGIHFGFLQRLANDGISWDVTTEHYYAPPNATGGIEAGAHYLFGNLAQFGKPIIMTEFNQQQGYLLSQDAQVETLTSMMDVMKELAPQYNIVGAYLYELLDEPHLADAEAHYGMASSTGELNTTGLAIQQYLHVPPGLTVGLASDTGWSSADLVTSDDALAGTAEAMSTLHFTVDGQAIAASVTADASGAWAFNPTGLADGQHSIVVTETTSSGATQTSPFVFTLDTTAPAPTWLSMTTTNGVVTLTGTTGGAEGESLSFYDGSLLAGTGTTGANGTFGVSTSYNANLVHVASVVAVDKAGNVGSTVGSAYLGGSARDSITGSSAADLILGNGTGDTLTGGGGKDTFIYSAASDSSFGDSDTITDFVHGVDVINFTTIAGIRSTNGVPLFQGNVVANGSAQLNPHSVGFLEIDGNTWVLVNTTNNAETTSSDMRIVLSGVGLGLTATDFHWG